MNVIEKIHPDFFIVGAPRSGTTSLHEYLNEIPEIFMCPKESGYFSKFSIGRLASEEEYKNSFVDATPNQLIGESTAIYLRDPETPDKIHQANHNAKIIIMLRDPIERAYSHYLMYVRNGYETQSFSKKLELYDKNKSDGRFHDYIIMPSYYFDSVSKYIDVFGREQVKICNYEEFADKTQKIVSEILDFLCIDSSLPKNITEKYNDFAHPPGKSQKFIMTNYISQNIGRRLLPKSTRLSIKNFLSDKNSKPKLEENDILKLCEFFVDDVTKIQDLLQQKLHWQHFPNTF